ncbi:hypothetical protein AAZX31_09G161700 [Glycine max]
MFDDNLLFEVLKHIDTSDVGMHKQAVTQGSHGVEIIKVDLLSNKVKKHVIISTPGKKDTRKEG